VNCGERRLSLVQKNRVRVWVIGFLGKPSLLFSDQSWIGLSLSMVSLTA
jgi:hypothetical protein